MTDIYDISSIPARFAAEVTRGADKLAAQNMVAAEVQNSTNPKGARRRGEMITDEMIEAAKECLPAEVMGNIHSALEATYPLIRAQVLEEAAAVCDRRFMGDNIREDLEAKRCAKAIRGMIKP